MRTRLAVLLSTLSLSLIAYAAGEPPGNVPRLSFISGTVSFSPAGLTDWVYAKLNRPLVNGDKLWADAGGRAEIQYIDSAFRLAEKTNANLLNFDDKTAQIQLPSGTMCVHVGSVKSEQAYEVDTPNLAFSIIDPGDYRIDVSPDGKTTTVQVKNGKAQVSGKGNSYNLSANQAYKFSSNDLSGKESGTITSDDFDAFCTERNKELPTPAESPNVTNQIPGTSELNNSDNGNWTTTQDDGQKAWTPNKPQGWSPYRDGNWVWIEPWGWTWVSNEPWGWAPYYYGRWRFIDRWFWIPIGYAGIPFFAPGLVRFLGGVGIIGFYPLGPRDLYIPTFLLNMLYLARLNNLTPNDRVIIDTFNNQMSLPASVNLNVPGAVMSIPQSDFGKPNAAATPMPSDVIIKSKPLKGPGVAPTKESVTGGGKPAHEQPPPDVIDRVTIAVKPVPPGPVPFDQKQGCLMKHPGEPCTPDEIAALNPQVPPTVIVIDATTPKEVCGAPQPPKVSEVPVTEPIRHKKPEPMVEKAVPKAKPVAKTKPKPPKVKVRKPQYPKYPKYYPKHYPKYPKYYPKHYPYPHYPTRPPIRIHINPVPQYTPPSSGPHVNVYNPGTCGGGGGNHC